jgi:hypothetical protein
MMHYFIIPSTLFLLTNPQLFIIPRCLEMHYSQTTWLHVLGFCTELKSKLFPTVVIFIFLRPKSLCRWYIDTSIRFLDIIHHLVFI